MKKNTTKEGSIDEFLRLFYIYQNMSNLKSLKKQTQTDGNKEYKRWVIYTKEGCPFCINAKDLLDEHHIKYDKKTETDYINEKSEVDSLTNNYKFFPKIFDDKNNFIGGFVDLEKLLKRNRHT